MNVVAVVDDVFFVARLQGAARQAGVGLTTVTAAGLQVKNLRLQPPALVIVDLNARSAAPLALIRQLKSDAELGAVPVVGFFSHVQVELKRGALEAGCTEVLPRSQLASALPSLLRQYAGAQA